MQMFSSLTEAQLRNKLDPAGGIFIAESPKVIRVALDAGMEPLALLCERRHIEGDAADIVSRLPHTVPDAWRALCHASPPSVALLGGMCRGEASGSH